MKRCGWVENTFDLYYDYHDHEWGVPVHDDHKHFEYLTLESAQAGLSWATILKKREGYRAAFNQFNVQEVANFPDSKIEDLMQNPEIIRNKLKISAAINNAQRFIEIQEAFGSFDQYIWGFVDGKTIVNHWDDYRDCPATTKESDALSKDLKKRGFMFVGSTTVYAHMQAAGLVMDHSTDCFRYKDLKG